MARTRQSKAVAGKVVQKEVETAENSAPAGTKAWQGSSKLVSGRALGEMSKYDETAEKFSHAVKIEHSDAFTLTPLIMTEGPLKGKRILVLDSIKPFRFMELPPEIRTMVYGHLMADPEGIAMTTCLPPGRLRRAVQCGFENREHHKAMGLSRFDKNIGKWVGQEPSDFALARVNKQLAAAETIPVMYGQNTFRFYDLAELKIFLQVIGRMCIHVKHIAILGDTPYSYGKGRSTFDTLSRARNLRTLSLGYGAFGTDHSQAGRVTIKKFIEDARPFLRDLKTAVWSREKAQGKDYSILDVIKVVKGRKCYFCDEGRPRACLGRKAGSVVCGDPGLGAHVRKLGEELRAALVKELRIKE